MIINASTNTTSGFEKITKFIFSVDISPISAVNTVLWNFGDGNISSNLVVEHYYNFDGEYAPFITVYGVDGNSELINISPISIIPYINESIYFDIIPPPTFAGHINRYPFKVAITSKIKGDHYIDLYAMHSRSHSPQYVKNNLSFLRPEWKFFNTDKQLINEIKTDDVDIFVDGKFAGVSGTAEFYFTDDIYNFDQYLNHEPYTTIIATLRTSATPVKIDFEKTGTNLASYANNTNSAFFPYFIGGRYPDVLETSENGRIPIQSPKWVFAKTPIFINTNSTIPIVDTILDGNPMIPIDFDFFIKYFPIDNSNIPIYCDTDQISSNIVPIPKEFKLLDDDGYKVSGYYKGIVNVENVETFNVQFSANVDLNVETLSGSYCYPILWVSNPMMGKIHNAQYFKNSLLASATSVNMPKAHVHTFDAPIIEKSEFDKSPMAINGFHGINSIAVKPFPSYQAWMIDSEKNYLYNFSTNGNMLRSVDINDIANKLGVLFLVENQTSPVSIALDSNENIWITLFDTFTVIKLDKFGVPLFITTPFGALSYQNPPNINPEWYSQIERYPLLIEQLFLNSVNIISEQDLDNLLTEDYFEILTQGEPANLVNIISEQDLDNLLTEDNFEILGESTGIFLSDNNFIEPTGIDTDSSNNVWVTYSHFASAYAIKYDENGMILNTISYSLSTTPQEVVCDNSDNVWIIKSNTLWGDLGGIEKRDSDGDIIYSIDNIQHPNHATIDKNQNLWFTFGYDRLGKINNTDGSMWSVNVSPQNLLGYTPDYWFNANENIDDHVFEGISTDYRGYVYLLNSFENQIYVIDSETLAFVDKFYINPQGKHFSTKGDYQPTNVDYNLITKSLQATGDWSGFQWLNKYGESHFNTNQSIINLKGSTELINYYLENPYKIFKINENFDLTEYIRSNTFIPSIRDSDVFFNEFLKPIYGSDDSNALGVKAYEKIANFLINTNDIDLCDFSHLKSISEMFGNVDDINIIIPESIKKIIELYSINESYLWGNSYDKNDDLKKIAFGLDAVNTTNQLVTAGIPMIIYTKSLNKYDRINTGDIDGQFIYTIQTFASSIGIDPLYWRSDYEFYIDTSKNIQTFDNNLIDWDNKNTNINSSLSAEFDNWEKTSGIVDTILSYELYKGLNLFD